MLRRRRPTTAARLEASSPGLLKASAKASTGFGLGVEEWATRVGALDGTGVGSTVGAVVGPTVGTDVGRADAGSLHAGDGWHVGHER